MSSVMPKEAPAPWLSVVGIGDDGLEGLSPRARALITAAETVFGGTRHLDLLPEQAGQERFPWPSPLSDALPWIRARRQRPVCVLASGDPFWYGVGATLARHFAPEEMAVVPAPSAFSLAAARQGWALQETACLSVHGRQLERVRPWLHPGARLLVLSWDGTTPESLARLLDAAGFGPSRLTVHEHLGGPGERRLDGTAAQWPYSTVEDLNTIAITCATDADARPIATTAGRPEAAFHHDDGQISKREVRAVILAHLAPGRGERLWDVGAGSGAIAVEWLLAASGNRAVAVEQKAARLGHIRTNAEAFGVPELEVVEGQAPDALDGLPPPDAVFIGGGLTTPGLLAHCLDALPAGGRLVATSVTVEGDTVLAAAAEQHGGALSRIAVSRAEPLGGLTGWSALRPVTLWAIEV